MPVLQLTLEVTQSQVEDCEEILFEAGALTISLEDAENQPLFEPGPNETPLWDHTKMIALFEHLDEDNYSGNLEELKYIVNLKNFLKEKLSPKIFQTLKIELVEDQDWVRTSLDQFKPQYFGNKLWITPTWIEINEANGKKKEDVVVKLDPGLAFGTGMHPTTALCLEWLAQHPPKNATVVDFGCGSGILGIAALKLGAKCVIAVDHDPQALISTQSNATINEIKDHSILVCTAEDFTTDRQFDLILANILANPLVELAPLFKKLLKNNGKIVLSGILAEQQESVLQAYQPWLHDVEVKSQGEWVRISGQK